MTLTADSPILGPASAHTPRIVSQTIRAYLAHPRAEYSAHAVTGILWGYCDLCASAGADPLVAVAQMATETTWLASWWAQPPRRNPAGIGVTGAPGAGLSFPSWSEAARAHIGRLLAYAMTATEPKTAVQVGLINAALAWRGLPAGRRGTVTTVGQLAGTWAADPQYAAGIVSRAGEILAAGT